MLTLVSNTAITPIPVWVPIHLLLAHTCLAYSYEDTMAAGNYSCLPPLDCFVMHLRQSADQSSGCMGAVTVPVQGMTVAQVYA